jgi:hypothetical protein
MAADKNLREKNQQEIPVEPLRRRSIPARKEGQEPNCRRNTFHGNATT